MTDHGSGAHRLRHRSSSPPALRVGVVLASRRTRARGVVLACTLEEARSAEGGGEADGRRSQGGAPLEGPAAARQLAADRGGTGKGKPLRAARP